MTIAVTQQIKGTDYYGLSSDSKPTGVQVNSTFFETDTRDKYITLDGDNWLVVDSPNPPRVSTVLHPFAKGSLTTTGAQYCTAVTGIDNDAYDPIDAQEIQQPAGYTLEEVEFALTARLDVSGTPTDNALWKWQVSDDGVSWEDLIAEQTLATPAAATEVSISGRFAPTGNFLGTGTSFHVRLVAKSSGATDTVSAETKNSSYIICRYRRS